MLRQIFAMTVKDLKIFFKDPGAVLLIFLMPLMFIVVMSYALAEPFGSVRDRAVPLSVVDEAGGTAVASLIGRLKSLDGFEVETRWRGQALTRERLETLIRDGELELGLLLPEGLSAALAGEAEAAIELMADPATPSQFVEPIRGALQGVIEKSRVEASLPGQIDELFESLSSAALLVKSKVKAGVLERMGRFLGEGEGPKISVALSAPPGMRAGQAPDPWQQNVPGYTLFGIFWIVVLLAESVLLERRDGTFRRLLVSPMSRAVMLGGKLLPYYLINLLQIALMLGGARLLFGMSLGSSPGGLVLVSMAAAAAATGLGVMVSALARTEAQTRGLTILVLLTLAALGGCFVPRFIMPQALQDIGLVTPHAWALDAYQDLLVRGQTVLDVLPGVGMLFAFAAVFFLVGVWRFRFQ